MSAGASRAFCAIGVIGCLLVLPGAFAFAQEEPAPDGMVAPTVDAHTLAEQAIVLGEGGAGLGIAPPAASPFGVLRVVLTLAAVAAAIYGFAYLLKRASRGRSAQDPFLKVLASAPIGANRGVYVVSLGSQAWLVGAAEHGVSLISEVADREAIDAMVLEDSRRGADSAAGRLPDFRSILRRFGMPADSAAPSPEDIRKRSERLKGI